jgi:hypothetical protein
MNVCVALYLRMEIDALLMEAALELQAALHWWDDTRTLG